MFVAVAKTFTANAPSHEWNSWLLHRSYARG